MPSAFIIRPFGTKKGIDFERVERELIDPALSGFQFAGRTTGDTLRQGNIRTEMFQRLLTADLVVVDISIGNANVFYELGIRHALRNKRTFLIRGSSAELPADEVPFDLKTDRYLSYDASNPQSALARLTEGLRQTLLSEDKDSPVFQLLPELIEQDKSHFLVVPEDFQEEVERAAAQEKPRYQWGDLKLLQTELQGFQWEIEGLRVVGRAQLRKKAYEYARDTWEAIRHNDPDDKEANTWLGTIYEELGDLTESSMAVQRVLAHEDTTQEERAEAYALIGRNLKERWKDAWMNLRVEQRQTAALRSPFLRQSYEAYKQGFIEDLNHYYSGINALGLLTTIKELAAALPDVWSEGFEDESDAERELKKVCDEWSRLSNSVTMSLEAAKMRVARAGKSDMWFSITLADLACLTSKRPAYVADKYRRALAGAQDFEIDAVRTQLYIYEQLAVLSDNVTASLQTLPSPDVSEAKPPHVLLFAGHMIDSPAREKPRFPADKEATARYAIREIVEQELERTDGGVIGLAGGASGGDIIFHEVCAEFKIPTFLYLALPREEYVKESVGNAGSQWVERFDALYERLPRRQLAKSKELPRWLQNKPNYNLWQRNNLWMLYNALARGSRYVTLIALWDGRAGDGLGGTEDMVNRANERGAKTVILKTKELFGL
ncbi:MAG TPA: tetratricopeptide repeat-containing protein [Pyrinomonadaceae bacterium]|nr:tetratricopeptide repeat-containing protein [Pyrinomonadaceae bacterium]